MSAQKQITTQSQLTQKLCIAASKQGLNMQGVFITLESPLLTFFFSFLKQNLLPHFITQVARAAISQSKNGFQCYIFCFKHF